MYDLETIRKNIESINEEISKYKRDVILLGATKTVPAETVNAIHSFGITDIGENRVQEFREKFPLVKEKFNWHIIGALQTNKVKYLIGKVCMIHSVDRKDLADEIDLRCDKAGIKMKILIEINIGREESKSGILTENLDELIDYVQSKPNLIFSGFMTVMPKDAEESLYERMQRIFEDKKEKFQLKYLSMGMSEDYRIALKYGANILRIGRAIFGDRIYNTGGR